MYLPEDDEHDSPEERKEAAARFSKSTTLEKFGAKHAPVFWMWLAEQPNNSDPDIAEAAKHIVERWSPGPWYNHAKVMRMLAGEDSPYMFGARKLTQEFAEFYNLTPQQQVLADLGSVSPAVPVTQEQCEYTYGSGKPCTRDAIPGAGKCSQHGGSWITDAERKSMVNQITARLIDVSDRATRVLIDLMDNARSEKVRLDAATAIFDRIGVGPIQTVQFDVTPAAEEASQEIKGRLLRLATRNGDVVANSTGEVIEGQVLSETVDDAQDV